MMRDKIKSRSKIVFSNSLKSALAMLLTATTMSACGLVNTGGDSENSHFSLFGNSSNQEADLAVVAYSQGNFEKADEHVLESLHGNKKNAKALLVGALLSEKTNRPNRARQFYEEILLYNGDDVSVLGTASSQPQKITDIARQRLRQLNLTQNRLIVEDNQGNKVFNMSHEAASKNNASTIKKALATCKNKTGAAVISSDIDNLFDESEKNTVARFIILKELAENDLITKEEFLRARQANIGGLLPLTHTPASSQVVKPVPNADIIIDRINALKAAVEDRAITAKEFTAERNLIIEAVLPPRPSQRLKKKAPAKEIIPAAKELRKLEVFYDLNLITSGEKDKERAVIEGALGLGTASADDSSIAVIPTQIEVQSQPQTNLTVQEVIKIVEPESVAATSQEPQTVTANKPSKEAKPLLPDVSSPFNK